MLVSFIIPAHNEEQLIGATLAAIRDSARELALNYETIVACDGCTDATAAIAKEHGARVVAHERRQIAATRNLGARDAKGEVFVFVDADTRINAASLREALDALRDGCVCGGGPVRFDGRVPMWVRVVLPLALLPFRIFGYTGGCFLFCTRTTFDAAGGWDETLYASEEIWFAKALKQHGKFRYVRTPVVTSGRKLRAYSGMELLLLMVRASWRPTTYLSKRENLDLWYKPRPDPDAVKPGGE